MKILQVNTTVNSGSTGRIAEDIGRLLIANGHESYIAFGRNHQPSCSNLIQIGSKWDVRRHIIKSRLLDQHGFGSVGATIEFVKKIQQIKPDLIHLHNIHGYYLNVKVLFEFLKVAKIPVVWTFHDCWPFTGHCSYFDYVNCDKWQQKCISCPNMHGYPKSWLVDNSRSNYEEKNQLFCGLPDVTIVTPSLWLADHVGNSFLSNYPKKVINNGVNLDVFRPLGSQAISSIKTRLNIGGKKMILGVASIWDRRKGFEDFVKLSKIIGNDMVIVLVGLNKKQQQGLPEKIIGIARTENTEELAALYSAADVFVNPTWVDNFPTTNIEALACGTPVITYNTGGSPEAIDENTGYVVEKGDIAGLHEAINKVILHGKNHYTLHCRQRSEKLFNKNERYNDYLNLYQNLLSGAERRFNHE